MDKIRHLISAVLGRLRDASGRIFLLPKLKDPDVLARFNEIAKEYARLRNEFAGEKAYPDPNPGYSWDSWSATIRNTFMDGVPPGFLATPVLSRTMVFARTTGAAAAEIRVQKAREILGDAAVKRLVKEDYIGLPNITDPVWLTSANRAHHAYHLAVYKQKTGNLFWETGTVVEWGGGYGGMARLARRMNPELTYIIVDLPELLALQYIYLYSVEAPASLNMVSSGRGVQKGKINFVPYASVMEKKVVLSCDSFISTWAITESPFEAQKFVIASGCFSAGKVLVAYNEGDSNLFEKGLHELGLTELPAELQPGNAYAYK